MTLPRRGLRRRVNTAEAVADVLRERILAGDDGMLPTQDEMMAEFDVSKAAVREACRILETEGLLSIRRGNVGGAAVHEPTPTNVAYSLSLVLNARRVALADVRATIGEIEPLCAGLCAGRRDRKRAVLPSLRAAHADTIAALAAGDGTAAALTARAWHEALVRGCGLETMAVIGGALEDVWSSHIRAGLASTRERSLSPDPVTSQTVVDDHARVIDLIAAGDVAGATAAAADHLRHEPRIHARADVASVDVRAQIVRDHLFSNPGA